MKYLNYIAGLLSLLLAVACGSQEGNKPRAESEKEDWQQLFNGEDLNGWDAKFADRELNDNHLETFRVTDSMIRISYDNYAGFDDAYGHLYYEEPFSYYKLRFEYRFLGEQTPGGASWNVRNSGVMLHAQSARSNELAQDFPVSVELQLLGGLGEGERPTGNACTPGTAVVMGDTVNYTHCITSNSLTYHGDQWVKAEAVVHGGEYMAFLIAGDTVLTFNDPQIGGGFISDANGRDDFADFGVTRDKAMWQAKAGERLMEGYIALQAESHPIDFKNIELLNLCGCMDEKASNYRSYFVKHIAAKCSY